MAELTLTIHGRSFGITCDDGQEQRVMELGHYVDTKLRDVAEAGGAHSESHLLVLTALMLTDEIFDLRDRVAQVGGDAQGAGMLKEDELAIAQAIDSLAERIEGIAQRVQKA